MKKETVKKSRGWFSKPIITDYFITKDGKTFLNEKEAIDWEWYLDNKDRILKKYQFTDFSPLFMGLHHINKPIFANKFYVETYNDETSKELFSFVMGKIFEHTNKWTIQTAIVNTIEHKEAGWFYVVLDETHTGEFKVYVSEYINKINVE